MYCVSKICNIPLIGGRNLASLDWNKVLAVETNRIISIKSGASEHNTSVRKYWKIPFYRSNTDTGTFYGASTDIDTDAQHPKYSTDILVFPVFYSISILCFKPLIDSCY